MRHEPWQFFPKEVFIKIWLYYKKNKIKNLLMLKPGIYVKTKT